MDDILGTMFVLIGALVGLSLGLMAVDYYQDIAAPVTISVTAEDFEGYVAKCKKVCSVDDLEFDSVRFAQRSPTAYLMNVGCYCTKGAGLKTYEIVIGVE